MPWLRHHPFATLFAIGGIILMWITLSFERAAPVPAQNGVTAISVGNTLQPLPANTPSANVSANSNPSLQGLSAPVSPPPSPRTPQSLPPSIAQSAPVAAGNVQVSSSSKNASLSASDSLLNEVYSLIPSSFYTPTKPMERTPEQQSLYLYGNAAGEIVLSFENAHTDMAQVLTDWFKDRSSAAKKTSAEEIAADMKLAGKQLADLPNVPVSAQASNASLAGGFTTAGTQLEQTIAAGGGDTSLVSAMEAYNASANDFTKDYAALVDLFSHNGVTFSSTDAGSAFQFGASGF